MDWNTLLSPKRIKHLETGKNQTSQPSGDPRSEFDRDYGRAVFASPVRRLQDKAQVFPLEQLDAVRTRLTHSLEVSTLSRSISRQACAWLIDRNVIDYDQAAAIEAIAMTVGLLHDIGNPPFGHAGEEAIGEWCSKLLSKDTKLADAFKVGGRSLSADFCDFEGNAQTIRLVSHLQMLGDRYGLNLTAGCLSALCKYIAPSDGVDEGDHARAKPGYFASEEELIVIVRQETGTGNARNPITYLVEAADDTVYSTVDIEDGIKKGVLSWNQFRDDLMEETSDDPLARQLIEKAEGYNIDSRLRLDGPHRDEAFIQLFRTFAMYHHVNAAVEAFKRNYLSIMKGKYKGELLFDGPTSSLVSACKTIARKRVYPSKEILRLELMGRKVIWDLLDFFWEAAKEAPQTSKKWMRSFPGKSYSLMSNNYRTIFQLEMEDDSGKINRLPAEYRRLQLVVDYVSGMTDSYATSLHRELGLGG